MGRDQGQQGEAPRNLSEAEGLHGALRTLTDAVVNLQRYLWEGGLLLNLPSKTNL